MCIKREILGIEPKYCCVRFSMCCCVLPELTLAFFVYIYIFLCSKHMPNQAYMWRRIESACMVSVSVSVDNKAKKNERHT